MALDTTVGGPASDSYASVAEATAYFAATGAAVWATSGLSDQEAALRRAAIWLDGSFRRRWPGTRASGRAQALDWPRIGAIDTDGAVIDPLTIPPEVKRAQLEAALTEIVSPRSLAPQVTMAGVVTSEKVGPVAITYAATAETDLSANMPILTSVEQILSGIVPCYDLLYPAALVV